MIKVLHHPTCSKSRAVLEFLDENGMPIELIDYIAEPLSPDELRALAKKLGHPLEEVVRKEEPLYREKYADRQMTDEDWVAALAAHPELLQRPILIKGGVAVLGRPLENAKLFLD